MFSVIMEMIPGDVPSRLVDPIEADNLEHAWALARAKWYNSPLAEQNRKILNVPLASGEMKHVSVVPQIVDIKEGEYVLPVVEVAQTVESSNTEPVSEPTPTPEPVPETPSESAPTPTPEAPPQPEAAAS
jgi:hypothetical protein